MDPQYMGKLTKGCSAGFSIAVNSDLERTFDRVAARLEYKTHRKQAEAWNEGRCKTLRPCRD